MKKVDATSERVRVAIYMRVSTPEQLDGFSLETQKVDLLNYVARSEHRGWYTEEKWQISEQGTGSSKDTRPGLQKIMEMAQKKEFDVLVIWKIDRISRNLSDLLEISNTLKEYGVSLASMKEDMDFTTPVGRLIFNIFGTLAEFERETIKMRTEEGKLTSARLGNYVYSHAPYGFVKVKNKDGKGSKLSVVPSEVEIVKQIFNWFVFEKRAANWIAQRLEEMGVPKGKGAKSQTKGTIWGDQTVRTILMNRIYIGDQIANRYFEKNGKNRKERPENQWIVTKIDPIVDPVTFASAYERLKNNGNSLRGGGKEQYMLRGKIIDMDYGKTFVGYKAGKGTKNYRRKKFKDAGGEHKTLSIAASELEEVVWSHIRLAIENPKRFLDLHKKKSLSTGEGQRLEVERTSCQAVITDQNKKIEKVEGDYYDEYISKDERNERVAKFVAHRDVAQEQLEAVEAKIQRMGQYQNACIDLKEFSERLTITLDEISYEQKCDLASMLVERVEVRDDKGMRDVNICFRFDQNAIYGDSQVGRTKKGHGKGKNGGNPPSNSGNGGQERIRTFEG